MEQPKSLQKYFIDGFSLLNRSITIYLIGIAVILISEAVWRYGSNSGDLSIQILFNLATLPITLIFFSYFLSTPVFFYSIKETGRLNYLKMLTTTLANAKRLVLPLVVTMIVIIVFGAIFFMLISSFSSKGEIFREAPLLFTQTPYLVLLLAVSALFISIFAFTPILFSLYNKGILRSAIKGLSISFTNPRFILVVFIINIISAAFLNTTNQDPLTVDLIKLFIGVYISLLVGTTALIYFLENYLEPSKPTIR